jgi:hypothetical protein
MYAALDFWYGLPSLLTNAYQTFLDASPPSMETTNTLNGIHFNMMCQTPEYFRF